MDTDQRLDDGAALDLVVVLPDDPFLGLIAEQAPGMYRALAYGYATIWFVTPYFVASLLMSLVTIVAYRRAPTARVRPLPPYPQPERREKLTLVLGETHFHTLPGRAPSPCDGAPSASGREASCAGAAGGSLRPNRSG